ncbi:MAG: helix-turn-helix domain-containing protein [Lachnospiraceae bacterium]|nr:helix-turn-helix domain-containing protein [Lachnospiraceae bacterium]
MNYTGLMQDCLQFIEQHGDEDLTAELVGRQFCLTGPFLEYLFDIYCDRSLEEYLQERQAGGAEVARPVPPARREAIRAVRLFLEETRVAAVPVSPEGMMQDNLPRKVQETLQGAEETLSLWVSGPEGAQDYMTGFELEDGEALPAGIREVRLPAGEYAAFSYETPGNFSTRPLLRYAFTDWSKAHPDAEVSFFGACEYRRKTGVLVCVPLCPDERELERPEGKTPGIEMWSRYIDENIRRNLTTGGLARVFGYSESYFRQTFRMYYDISVMDYIKKRRLVLAAEALQQGEQVKRVARDSGFRTPAGFTRAFEREFHMTPEEYRRGDFQVVDLQEYCHEYAGKLISSQRILPDMKMLGMTILSDRGDDIDMPAQVQFWLHRDFPCLKNARDSGGRLRREEKIGMWWHDTENQSLRYILGPVVEDFGEVTEEMTPVDIRGGLCRVFSTDRDSDREQVADTLRMFSRCVFLGWIRDHRDRLDSTRLIFERYVDDKIYIYVPIFAEERPER